MRVGDSGYVATGAQLAALLRAQMIGDRMNVLFCDAIRARRLVRFAYGGYERVIEPHAYGVTRDGHELLTGWLVSGWSASAPGQGWRTYRVDQISDAVATSQSFTAPWRGYRFNDPRLQTVYCQLEPLTVWPVS
jgi:hypothetical protein